MKRLQRRRSKEPMSAFAFKAAVILTGFVVLANVGYLLAQTLVADPNLLLRQAIGGNQFLFNVDVFLYLRSSPVIPIFGVAIVVFVAIALGHYFTFGAKDMTIQDPADAIGWWSLTERVIHGIVVVSFLVLLISGLSITFGRFFGGGTVRLVLRIMHEYAGFVYLPVFVIMVLMWIREALPKGYDLKWFAKFGGYLGYQGTLVSGKFNAGQKVYFWVMAITGIFHAWSGLMLVFQAGGMMEMRYYVVMHFIATIPMVLMFVVHAYLTTLGIKGSFMGMIHGRFSKTAAQHYHSDATPLKTVELAQAESTG